MEYSYQISRLIEDLRRYLHFQKQLGITEVVSPLFSKAKKEKIKSSFSSTDLKGVSADVKSKLGGQTIVVPDQPDIFIAQKKETLEDIKKDLGNCTRCKLHKERTNIVFGEGNPNARLVFVGEGPGREEDKQGRPFVGRAGQLLNKIIKAMGLERSDVYICNVVKCRPPNNRNPEPDEVAACEPFLLRQIRAIDPEVIVCLGSVASSLLLKVKNVRMSELRGKFHQYGGAKLMVTYHPAALLRNPALKKLVWEDMKMVMRELGLSKTGD